MKKFPLILILLLLFTCDLNSGSDNTGSDSEEEDYSAYLPESVTDYVQAPGFYSNYSNYSINSNQSNLLDMPSGDTVPDNSSIVTLGEAGGYVTVKFDPPIEDITGYDFIVYGNSFLSISAGEVNIEPGFVEVSSDNLNWYLLVPEDNKATISKRTITYNKSDYDDDTWPSEESGTTMTLTAWESSNYDYGYGFCDYTPTEVNSSDEDKVVFYANQDIRGGGDSFKLEWAVDENFNSVTLSEISYIKISTGYRDGVGTAGDYTAPQTEIDSIVRIESAQ